MNSPGAIGGDRQLEGGASRLGGMEIRIVLNKWPRRVTKQAGAFYFTETMQFRKLNAVYSQMPPNHGRMPDRPGMYALSWGAGP